MPFLLPYSGNVSPEDTHKNVRSDVVRDEHDCEKQNRLSYYNKNSLINNRHIHAFNLRLTFTLEPRSLFSLLLPLLPLFPFERRSWSALEEISRKNFEMKFILVFARCWINRGAGRLSRLEIRFESLIQGSFVKRKLWVNYIRVFHVETSFDLE